MSAVQHRGSDNVPGAALRSATVWSIVTLALPVLWLLGGPLGIVPAQAAPLFETRGDRDAHADLLRLATIAYGAAYQQDVILNDCVADDLRGPFH